MFSFHKVMSAAVLAAVLALAAVPAQALDMTNVAFVQVSAKTTSIPVGHSEFCQSRPGECGANKRIVDVQPLDETRWAELQAINTHYNQTIVPVTDMELYGVEEFWTYPNGYGDCEDFALAKRRDLINAGWPASTLLMSIVREANGDGHAVLLVRTDRGDLVLDNQEGAIKLWSDTPYQFIKRQSQANSGQWVDMFDSRPIYVAAAQ